MDCKKTLIIALASAGLLGGAVTVSNMNPTVVQAKSSSSSYTTKHSIVYKNKNGIMRITSAQGFLAKNGNYKPEHQIILYGTFYNKSSHGIAPENFFHDHFKAFQVMRNTWHELYGMDGGAASYKSTNHIESLENIAEDTVRPHRSVRFAVVDEFAKNYWQGQKIAVRSYNEADFGKHITTKKFSLNVYGHQAKAKPKQQVIPKVKKVATKKTPIKKQSNPLIGDNPQFVKFPDSYVYNDSIFNLDMKPADTNYHPATSGNSARVTMTFDFRNKTHQPVNVADAINARVKVMQDGTYFTLKTASGAPTILAHGNRMTPIRMYIEGNLNGQDPITLVFQEDSSRKEDGVVSVALSNDEPPTSAPKQTNNAPQNSASSSNTQTNSSSTSSQFTGFPAGAGYMEKAKIIFSLSGDARKQADLQLMKDLGEVDAQGRPEVPIASFEAHLREMYDSVQRMSESIEHGGQTPLQFK